MRTHQYHELKNLKQSSVSVAVLESMTDAEKDLATLVRESESRHGEYVGDVDHYHTSLVKEREMTAAIERQLEMSKIEVSACRRLLEVMTGCVGERKGVGMLVRTHPHRRGEYCVKELYEGGSAALSARIHVGDS